MEYALLQAVFLPFLFSPVAYVIGRKIGANDCNVVYFWSFTLCTILVILAALGGTYEEHYPWTNNLVNLDSYWMDCKSVCDYNLCFVYHSCIVLQTIHDSQIQGTI